VTQQSLIVFQKLGVLALKKKANQQRDILVVSFGLKLKDLGVTWVPSGPGVHNLGDPATTWPLKPQREPSDEVCREDTQSRQMRFAARIHEMDPFGVSSVSAHGTDTRADRRVRRSQKESAWGLAVLLTATGGRET
jgi:hypothetical protein